MKLFITIENAERLKHSFINLKLYSVIYVPEILEQHGYTYETIDDYSSFIISNHINNLIKTYSKSKRIRGIFYSNPLLNEDVLPNIFESAAELTTINQIALLDDYNVPKLKSIYHYFDEIIFFPTIKKIRLIECTSLNKHLKNQL